MEKITVAAHINAPVEKVWKFFTSPEHIVKWNHASDDWHTTKASNDLRVGGTLNARMEAKNGSNGFDFKGTYTEVDTNEFLAYTMEDGRRVEVFFRANGDEIDITETFDAENENPIEMQKDGWQAILNNFRDYVEAN